MKRWTLLMIAALAFIGIALSASSTTADEKDRQKNVTVSFGQWDPNDPDLQQTPDPLPTGQVG